MSANSLPAVPAAARRQIGIRLKITLGYIIILALLLLIALILLLNLRNFINQFTFVTDHDFRVIELSLEIEKLMVDMETGQRGFIITGDPVFLEPFEEGKSEFDRLSAELFELISDNPAQTALLQEIVGLKDTWLAEAGQPRIEERRVLGSSQLTEANFRQFNDIITTVGRQTGKSILDSIRERSDRFIEVENELNNQRVLTANTTLTNLQGLTIILSGIAILAGLGIGLYLGRSIASNIRKVLEAAQQIGAGNYAQRANVQSNDEVDELAQAFNTMADNLQKTMASQVAKEYIEGVINQYRSVVGRIAQGDLTSRLELEGNGHRKQAEVNEDLYQLGMNLNDMIGNLNVITRQVREAVIGIMSAADEIQAATTQQIASTTEQDAAVTQTVATVEEVRMTVQQTAERAQAVAEAAQQSVEVSRRGENAVKATVDGMQIIRQRVENIAETILSLSERTKQIGEIINTVNAIADQSKLLALNASIEAARAGDEGRGFAVVAAEVRQLAEQSREATARIGEILNEIQQATNTAVMVTEEGSKGAEHGVELVNHAGEAIRDLASTLAEATQAAMQIAASTHQQTNGMNQLAMTMQQIKLASTQSAASSTQTERSARDLTQTSRLLEQAVARYKLQD
jgi:methyl-accepting chemotaxis protein